MKSAISMSTGRKDKIRHSVRSPNNNRNLFNVNFGYVAQNMHPLLLHQNLPCQHSMANNLVYDNSSGLRVVNIGYLINACGAIVCQILVLVLARSKACLPNTERVQMIFSIVLFFLI